MRDPVDPSWPEILFWGCWCILSMVLHSGSLFLAGVALFVVFTMMQSARYKSWQKANQKDNE